MSEPLIGIRELKMLAEVERQMDAREIPWVRVEGCTQRASIESSLMKALNLQTGQTISWFLYGKILKLSLQLCLEKIAEQNTKKLIDEELDK